MKDPRRATLVFCLATVYLVWGSSYLATRIGVLHLPPLLFAGIRYTVAGIVLTAIASARGLDLAAVRREWRLVAVLGLAGILVSNGLQVWAMQWVPSNLGALLNASSAFWIVLFGLGGRRAHRPDALAIAGILIGFAGTAVLVWPGGPAGPAAVPLLPQFAILLACIAWSLATIYLRNADTGLDVFALTGLQMLGGGVAMCLSGVVAGEASRFHLDPVGLAAMAWLAVFSSCLAYTAYTWLARNASPAQTGTYGYVNPVIAAGLGYLVLGEQMSARQIAGSAVIVLGVALVNWPARGTMRRPLRPT